MKIEVYTDGSATIATKPGGYGWVIVIDGVKHSEGSGRMDSATNNDAELEAAIMGLAAALKFVGSQQLAPEERDKLESMPLDVTLVSDSQIILRWAAGTQRFKQHKKIQKFKALQFLMKRLSAKTRWVQGHSGDEHNNRCDRLANWARKGIAEPKPQARRKRSVTSVNLGIAINDSLLYDMCYESYRHASSGEHPSGGNHWLTMFTDKLKEQMENGKYFSLEVKK